MPNFILQQPAAFLKTNPATGIAGHAGLSKVPNFDVGTMSDPNFDPNVIQSQPQPPAQSDPNAQQQQDTTTQAQSAPPKEPPHVVNWNIFKNLLNKKPNGPGGKEAVEAAGDSGQSEKEKQDLLSGNKGIESFVDMPKSMLSPVTAQAKTPGELEQLQTIQKNKVRDYFSYGVLQAIGKYKLSPDETDRLATMYGVESDPRVQNAVYSSSTPEFLTSVKSSIADAKTGSTEDKQKEILDQLQKRRQQIYKNKTLYSDPRAQEELKHLNTAIDNYEKNAVQGPKPLTGMALAYEEKLDDDRAVVKSQHPDWSPEEQEAEAVARAQAYSKSQAGIDAATQQAGQTSMAQQKSHLAFAGPIAQARTVGENTGAARDAKVQTAVAKTLAVMPLNVQKAALSDAGKIQMRKVNSAYSIYALIDPEHAEDPIDPKQLTNLDYDRMAKELPPASINELSLNVAQLLVSSGTMSQSEYQDVSQKTGKQQLAALDQYLGTDLGIAGTTAENMRRIYTTAYREGNRAWQTLSSATGGSINPNAAHTKKIGDNPAPGGVRRRTFNPATGKAE